MSNPYLSELRNQYFSERDSYVWFRLHQLLACCKWFKEMACLDDLPLYIEDQEIYCKNRKIAEEEFNTKVNPKLYKRWLEEESFQSWIESGCEVVEHGQFDVTSKGGIANLVIRKFGDKESEPFYGCDVYTESKL